MVLKGFFLKETFARRVAVCTSCLDYCSRCFSWCLLVLLARDYVGIARTALWKQWKKSLVVLLTSLSALAINASTKSSSIMGGMTVATVPTRQNATLATMLICFGVRMVANAFPKFGSAMELSIAPMVPMNKLALETALAVRERSGVNRQEKRTGVAVATLVSRGMRCVMVIKIVRMEMMSWPTLAVSRLDVLFFHCITTLTLRYAF